MRTLMIVLSLVLTLSAKEYYAKVEPYEILTISSNVQAQVLKTLEKDEGKLLSKKAYVILDATLDRVEQKQVKAKIVALDKTLQLNEDMLKNYEDILEKKKKNYDRVKSLKIKSDVEKDKEFYDLVNSQNQYLSTLKEIENLNIQINDLKLRSAQLAKSLDDKYLTAPGYVLYKLMVKPGQVVSMGTPLAEIADVKRAKLTIYLSAAEMKDAKDAKIKINGQLTSYKIDRLWNIADSQHLSSFKAQIIIDAPDQFSKLVKIELFHE